MIACVDIAALPLQLLLAERKNWRNQPVAVVAEDKPQAPITWVNEAARARGVLPGMRHSQGLSLCGALRATTVDETLLATWKKRIIKTLRHYSPRIEPEVCGGTFFVDASGLERIYPSLEFWGRAVAAELKGLGLVATIVIGFERMTTYALAQASPMAQRVHTFDDRETERSAAYAVSIDRLPIAPKTRDRLLKLGIRTLGELVALPEDGIAERFGAELATALATWKGQRPAPLVNQEEILPVRAAIDLDDAETDSERLLFLIKRMLHPLLATLAERGEALKDLHLLMDFERNKADGPKSAFLLTPAEPTLDAALLLDLVRLKLNALFSRGEAESARAVKRVELVLAGARATQTQLSLFVTARKRDLRAAERAFSRLRAEFGADAVTYAKLRDGHLPEARFQLVPMQRLTTPSPRPQEPSFIRRFHRRGRDLPQSSRMNPEGWLIGGLELGPVRSLAGPHIISGGWWRGEIQRDYYFAEVKRGDLLWVYYDHTHRQWRLQGRVE